MDSKNNFLNINITMDKLQDFFKKQKGLSNDDKNLINSIFQAADNGCNGQEIAKDNILSGDEIKTFFDNISSDISEKLKQFFYSSNSNNYIVETIGDFDYKNCENPQQKQDLETMNAFIEKHSYKLDKKRLESILKIKQMIENNEIMFENGLSEGELLNLAELDNTQLKMIANKQINVNNLQTHSKSNDKILSGLMNNDFSEFTKDITAWDMLIIIKEYEEKTGMSLYQKLINQFENNEINQQEFLERLKPIFRFMNFDLSRHAIIKECPEDLQLEKYKIIDILGQDNYNDAIDINIFKNYDFEKCLKRLNNQANLRLPKFRIQELYNVEKSLNKNILPNIQTQKNSETEMMQTINGNDYTLKYTDNGIYIKDFNSQETYEINYNKLLYKIENENDKNLVKNAIKKLSAATLIDLSIEVDFIETQRYSTVVQGIASENSFVVDLNNIESETELSNVIAHELGHCVDSAAIDNNTEEMKNLYNVMLNEYNQSKNKDEYTHGYCLIRPNELFAECYALLNNGSSGHSNYTLLEDFPETLKCVKSIIEKIRTLPKEIRNGTLQKTHIFHDWKSLDKFKDI